MEKKINKTVEKYISDFKNKIKEKILSENFEDNTKINNVLEFIYDFERLTFKKEDFSKRKRIKNSIPSSNRCIAKIADGEQCTRRRKTDCEYCGTHCKGIPHGSIQENVTDISQNMHSVVVFSEEIKGIVYFIDNSNNVYKTEDILAKKENPMIVAKAIKTPNGYSIPEFGI